MQTPQESRIIRVAASQFRLTLETSTNLDRVLSDMDQAAEKGAGYIVFPELALSGYPPEDAESLDYVDQQETAEALEAVQDKAKQRNLVTIVGAVWEEAGETYNRAFLISSDGTIAGTFDKLHPFHREPLFFTNGTNLRLFELDNVHIGLLICFDIRFPEPWRALKMMGAEVIFLPMAAAGSGEWKVPVLEGFMRTRASENEFFVAAANNAGPIQMVKSAIFDPDGLLVVQANYGREEVLVADIDLARVGNNFLEARRTDIAEIVIK